MSRRDYSKENIHKFKNYIQSISFSDMYKTYNPNKAYNTVLETFTMLYNQWFPFEKNIMRTKAKPQWLSRGIKIVAKKKRELNKTELKKYSKMYKNIIQKTLRDT